MKETILSGQAPQSGLTDDLCVNTIRMLAVDAVQKANSGHPGMPMGAAPMAYVLWTRFLKHNPRQSPVAGPGPVCPVRRARLHAAVQLAPSYRI